LPGVVAAAEIVDPVAAVRIGGQIEAREPRVEIGLRLEEASERASDGLATPPKYPVWYSSAYCAPRPVAVAIVFVIRRIWSMPFGVKTQADCVTSGCQTKLST
jgi:hypothetical protein